MNRLIKDYNAVLEELDLKNMHNEVYNRISRVKRSLKRLIINVKNDNSYAKMQLKHYYKIYKSNLNQAVKVRSNNLFVLPFMDKKEVKVYNGKTYQLVKIKTEMFGRYLGEFIKTRTKGAHSKKGISGDKIKR